MTFADSANSGGSSSFAGPIGGGGGGSGTFGDQIYEMRRRLHLIDQGTRIAGATQIDPNMAFQLAQQPIPDDELVQQTIDGMSAGQIEELAADFKTLPQDVAIGHWKSLTKPMQMALQSAGVNPMMMTKERQGIHPEFSLDFVGDIAAAGVGAADWVTSPIQPAISQGLHYLNVAGDTVPHLFRSTTDQDQSSQRLQLLDADLRNRMETQAGREFTDEEWRATARPFWAQYEDFGGGFGGQIGAAGEGAQAFVEGNYLDGVTADPHLEQQVIDLGNEVANSEQYNLGLRQTWNRVATGEEYIEPRVQLQVLDELDGDWEKFELANAYVVAGADITKMVNPDLEVGSPEYSAEWQRLATLLASDEMMAATTELSGGKVTIGRAFADALGIDETAPGDIDSWYGALSGGIDAAVMIFADPSLIGGKIRTAYRTSALVLENVDDALRMTDVVKADAVRRGVVDISEVTFNNPDMVQRLDRMRHSVNPATNAWWRAQSRIAHRNWRGADSIAQLMRGLDSGDMDNFGMAWFARNPGVSRGLDRLLHEHDRLRKAGEEGLTSADRVLTYLSSDQGFIAMAGGRLSRHTRSGLELPQQTFRQSRGLTVRNGARRTLDEIHDAYVAKNMEDLGMRADGRTTQEVLEELTGETPGFGTRLARIGVATPVMGRLLTGAQRTADSLSTHVPFQRVFELAGDGTVSEARKLFMLSRFGEMSTREADRHFMQFLGSMTGADDLSTMRDMLRRQDFDELDVEKMLRRADETNVSTAMDELIEMSTSVADRKRLERMKGLAIGGQGVNVEGRRRIMANFFDEVFRDAGVYKSEDGQRWAERWIGNVEGQRYGVGGMDTMVLNGQDTPVGILPLGDWSMGGAQVDIPGFLRHTQEGNVMRRIWRTAHNAPIDGFMQHYWKPAMLLRLGFIPRAAGEELLSFIVRDGVGNYLQMQRALTAARPDDETFLPLRPFVAALSAPGRTYRRMSGLTTKARGDMIRNALRGSSGLENSHDIKVAIEQLQDLERLIDINAGLRTSVGRAWYQSALMARGREAVYRGGDGTLVKTWTNKATREMRIAEMGGAELLAHFMAGEATRWVRGAARWKLSDELLTSAQEMLYSPNVSAAWTEMIGSNGMLLNTGDIKGAESTTINLLADGAGRPIISLNLKSPPGGSVFDEISPMGGDGVNLHNSFRFQNELERVFRDDVVRNYLGDAMRGGMSPDQARRIAGVTMGTRFQPLKADRMVRNAEGQAKVIEDLGFFGDEAGRVFTGDGQLSDQFLETYEDLVNRARLGVSAGDEGAVAAQSRLALMQTEVNLRRGFHGLSGEVDGQQIQRLVALLRREGADALSQEDRLVLNEVARRWGNIPGEDRWGLMEPRDHLLSTFDEAAEVGGRQAREYAEDINARPPAVGMETLGEFQAKHFPEISTDPETVMFSTSTGDELPEFVYRVVSDEDYQRMRAERELSTDGRSNVEGGTHMHASVGPDWENALSPGGDRVLKIRVEEEDGWEIGKFGPDSLTSDQTIPWDRVEASPAFTFESRNLTDLDPNWLPHPDEYVRILADDKPARAVIGPDGEVGQLLQPGSISGAEAERKALIERAREELGEMAETSNPFFGAGPELEVPRVLMDDEQYRQVRDAFVRAGRGSTSDRDWQRMRQLGWVAKADRVGDRPNLDQIVDRMVEAGLWDEVDQADDIGAAIALLKAHLRSDELSRLAKPGSRADRVAAEASAFSEQEQALLAELADGSNDMEAFVAKYDEVLHGDVDPLPSQPTGGAPDGRVAREEGDEGPQPPDGPEGELGPLGMDDEGINAGAAPTAFDQEIVDEFPTEPVNAQVDLDQAELLGQTGALSAPTGGMPGSYEEALEIETLDQKFKEIADRIFPGWDNEATDISNYFRGRSDDVISAPKPVDDITPETIIHSIDKIRQHIAGYPPAARARIKRYALGDHDVPLSMRTKEDLRDEIDAIMGDLGREPVLLDEMMRVAGDFPDESSVSELIRVLSDLDPATRYLVVNDDLPVWLASETDLRSRMVAAARRGITDPDNLPFAREMARFLQTRDGRRVAQPLPRGMRRIVTVMGDRELLTALRNLDRTAAFTTLRQKGMLDADTEGFLNRFLDNLLDDDVAIGFARGNTQVGDSPISALSSVGSDDYTMMARVSDMLDEILDPAVIPSGPRLKHLGQVDVADQSVGNFGLTWQLEDLGNGAVKLDDPLVGNSRHYSTTSGRVDFDGTVMDGVDPNVPIEDWAEVLTDFVLHMSGRNGSLNHHLIEPVQRGDLTLDAVRNTPGHLLPEKFVAPRLVEDDTNVLQSLVRRGFDNVISPAIDAIVRQPMFLSAFHKQRQVLLPVMNRFRDQSLEAAARAMADEFPGTRHVDDMKAILHDVPPAIWDNGISDRSRKQIVKALRDADDPSLDKAADFFESVTDEGFATLQKWAKQEEAISTWGRAQATQLAVDDVIPFIDDTTIRSYYQEYVRNLMPFYFAQEQFIRRWARTFAQTPEAVRKMQLMYQGIEHAGFVQTDEFGNDYFIYPVTDGMSEWLANTPVLEHMFGGGGRIPNVLEFTGQTAYAMPGMDDPFGIPSLGPIGAIPMGMLTNHFPELEPIESALLSERGVDRDLAEQLVPSWALQSYRAIVNDPKFEEQLNSTTIRAMAALEVQGTQLRLDAEEARDAGDIERADELDAEAAEYSLREGAEPREVEVWIDQVKSYARRMLFFKGIFASAAPASPQLADTATLRPEFQEMLQNVPFEEAVQLFMAQNPEALPFTISATDNPSMAQVPATEATDEWLNANGQLVDRYPVGGPWLIPSSDSTGAFHRKAWTDMQAAGIRTRKTPESWYEDLKFAAGAGIYFQSLENYNRAMLQAGDNTEMRQQIQLGWDTFRTGYLTQHPLFAAQLNGESQSRKQEVFDELALALRDPEVPNTPQTVAMRQMVVSYENFAETLGRYTGDQRGEAETIRAQLRHGLYVWAQQFMLEHPEVSNLWRSVIEPLAGLRGYGAEIAITGSQALPEGVSDAGAVQPGEPLAL